ncbi:MAG: bifunctional pyr operon transcriptional regulator/uracil phosphoribosyltransferase PyrR [Desulfonauticus sp.]|nr:bifunctional pyr operon transcriptional regulator/uracil phosphoribosyltransferase PyrR [Desulfonauticus sp.]
MKQKTILTAQEINKIIERLAYEVLEKISNPLELALVGIQRRGVDIASKLQKILYEKTKIKIPLGSLDINLYRDDWTNLASTPFVNASNIPFEVENKEIILVDDVIFTGRTIRAALDALLDFGRPNKIKLLVLIDRGHRELPIHPDFTGKKLNTSLKEKVHVFTLPQDGKEEVVLEQQN